MEKVEEYLQVAAIFKVNNKSLSLKAISYMVNVKVTVNMSAQLDTFMKEISMKKNLMEEGKRNGKMAQ